VLLAVYKDFGIRPSNLIWTII